MWSMRAGMGDVVFAPLYEALRRRGVRFEFFHRLTNVGLRAGQGHRPGRPLPRPCPRVRCAGDDCQAADEYQPLVDFGGRPCWLSYPDFDQLTDGARLDAEGWNFESHWDRRRAGTRSLEVGRDFDFVVLGVGIGALPYVCPEILARDQRVGAT